jgi:hypothetical protein
MPYILIYGLPGTLSDEQREWQLRPSVQTAVASCEELRISDNDAWVIFLKTLEQKKFYGAPNKDLVLADIKLLDRSEMTAEVLKKIQKNVGETIKNFLSVCSPNIIVEVHCELISSKVGIWSSESQ